MRRIFDYTWLTLTITFKQLQNVQTSTNVKTSFKNFKNIASENITF